MISQKILVVYPAIKSTFVAVYRGTEMIFLTNIKHKKEDLSKFNNTYDQKDFRKELVLKILRENDIDIEKVEIIMGRGGLLKPLNSGVYEVNEKMLRDLKTGIQGDHPMNLGGIIAWEIGQSIDKKAYIADPIVVDELEDIARVSGHPLIKRRSMFHALSHKHFARKYAKSQNKNYKDLRLIIAHIGIAGISIGAHKDGRVIDVNQSYDGEGPFTISRTGSLPLVDVIKLCFNGKYSEEEATKMITHEGGYAAYLGTDNFDVIDQKILSGDKDTLFYSSALAYQVSKEIGAMATVLECKVDAILLTGNIFNSERFLANVSKRVGEIAPIALYPSQLDLEALALNGMRVLMGETEALEYK